MTAFSATAEYGTAEIPRAVYGVSCESASYAVAGQGAQQARPMSPALFSLAGMAALGVAALVAAAATFGLAGKAVALPASVAVAPASYAIAARAAELAWPTPAASFAWQGQSIVTGQGMASAKAAFVLAAVAAQSSVPTPAASFMWSGTDAGGIANQALDPRTFTLIGGPVLRTFTIGLGIPGEPATAEYGTAEFPRYLTFGVEAVPAAFTMAGQDALLTAAPVPAAYILMPGRAEASMPVNPAAFGLAGQMTLDKIAIAIGKATFALTPQPIALFALDGTAFTLSGQSALLRPSLERASFALTGAPAFSVKWLGVGPGNFALSGKPALLNFGAALSRANFNLLGWSVTDITGPSGAHSYLIEVQAHDGTSLRTFYLSTDGFTSQPFDSPANQYYEPRIIDPGNFERALFDGTALRGRAKVGSGDIRVASSDPGNGEVLDDWLNYGWSRRDIRIKSLPKGAKSLSQASTLFVGKLDNISSTQPLDYLDLKIGDRLTDLEQPLLTDLFAGTTTTTGATAEGNADLKGKIKQRCWGQCPNVPLQPANPYDLIYLASDGAVTSIAVYDGGSPLTYDGDSANISTLRAATIAGGHYRTCLAAGLVRLGSLPDKVLTADVVEGSSVKARTAGQIAYRMLLAYGVSSTSISTGSIDALDLLNSAECCYFVDDDRTAITAVQDVIDSIGAWMVPDRDGTLVFGRFNAPASAPQSTYDVDTVAIGDTLDRVDNDLPSWRVLLQYGPNFTVQNDNDLEGVVTAARRAYLAKDFRTTTAENTAVQVKHLSATEVTIKTYLIDPTAAAAEATRQLGLLSADRQRYELTMPLGDAWPNVPGDSITLRHPRLGLSFGKPFTVLQRVDKYATETIQFSLWG